MNGRFNVWNKWDPLKTVMLGDCYGPEFFRDIKNPRIRSALDRIATETKEDLEYYETVLKKFGCEVLRPSINAKESILEHIDKHDNMGNKLQGVPRSPLQPRDCQMVIGDKLIFTHLGDHRGIKDSIIKNYPNKSMMRVLGLGEDLDKRISAPFFTLVGKDLYIDIHPYNNVTEKHIKKIRDWTDLPIRINTVRIGGHNDGVFHTVKSGAILSLRDIQDYQNTFPGWEICYLPDQGWEAPIEGFLKIKSKVKGKWWVPGEEENDEFTYFVETWLQDWVGYCEESVFDVNVLMLDDRYVCVNNYNETAFAFFKKHKIEPIIIPWRHRYFWDGGLHCITLDLYREGEMQDYFPNRSGPIVDLGYD
jgi:hypothetical protein